MAEFEGILLCNKPLGMSSHDMVDFLRKTTGLKKIGHTGTLDPLATGLLVVCLGRATKIVRFIVDTRKIYQAQIKLGMRSTTYDSEGVIDEPESPLVKQITGDNLKEVLASFEGKSQQKVPVYSAVKVDGQRLYKITRNGIDVDPPSREITIDSIELTRMDLPYIEFEVSCLKGTYIRSLANDIGEKLGCGAYLSRLHRTGVGWFNVEDALSTDAIQEYYCAGILGDHIKPIESAVSFPSINIKQRFEPDILIGRTPTLADVYDISGEFGVNEIISLKNRHGKILAIGKSTIESSNLSQDTGQQFFKYVRVLN
jgi:tRNA pseudouridine55 synthase